MNNYWDERLEYRKVKYTLEVNGQFVVIENVPARVNMDTAEQLFSPNTVARLQKMIGEHKKPKIVIRVPVYDFD